jgi:uncharacterized protein YggU (UPF0235/DUF167 family)
MSEGEFFTFNGKIVSLKVRAKPGMRQDAILGVRAGELVIAVRSVAEKGKANKGIIRILARVLGVPRDSVMLRVGAISPHKIFNVPLEAIPELRRIAAGSR